MARKRKRKPFETPSEPQKTAPVLPSEHDGSIFGFFKDYGIRETIESIIVAIVLALMFRAYEAEAFIIPTGSMAPTLQGQHMDVVCDQCNYQYRAGATLTSYSYPVDQRADITKTYCPICRHGMKMNPRANADHKSNYGDRILVNKFVYDFQSPERFDVIVFKNPNNGKQNYIKRLVGLPGDNLLIENGDIYNIVTNADGKTEKQIVRKPADKVRVMLQLVDDTNHIASKFRVLGWPSRWQQWKTPDRDWKIFESGNKPNFVCEGNNKELAWLRYRHLVPHSSFDEFIYSQHRVDSRPTEWERIEEDNEIPVRVVNGSEIATGALIRDYYEYNDRRYQFPPQRNSKATDPRYYWSLAPHWVGDLAFESDLVIESDTGNIAFDLVEGGVHFICTIDIATGTATLTTTGDNGQIQFDCPADQSPTAQTPIKGHGSHNILYAQLDDQVHLFVDGRHIEFNGSSYTNNSGKRPMPKYSKSDPGDAEPLGIGAQNANVRINRLKVFRDIFYIAPYYSPRGNRLSVDNELETVQVSDLDRIRIYGNPESWNSRKAKTLFGRPVAYKPMFELGADEYFPMGDNSPASQDARIWPGEKCVKEDMLIGRAMFIYWPHSLNKPVKFFPNFRRMGFIR